MNQEDVQAVAEYAETEENDELIKTHRNVLYGFKFWFLHIILKFLLIAYKITEFCKEFNFHNQRWNMFTYVGYHKKFFEL